MALAEGELNSHGPGGDGHGVGIEPDELPVLARGVDAPLEAGMVFALEPKFVFPKGRGESRTPPW